MNVYDKYRVVNIPFSILIDSTVTDKEKVIIGKILSFNSQEVSIVEVFNQFGIKKEDIAPLVEKKKLKVVTKGIDIFINVTPIFEITENLNNQVVASNNVVSNNVIIDHQFIERITLIWNQTLNTLEIDKINEWLNSGITKQEIELAAQKAIFNNARNFAYVETILLNNRTKKESTISVTRNVELY